MQKIAGISFFLLVAIGFLYLGNLVVYDGIALAFGIADATQLFWLGAVLGFFSASFIAATLIGNWRYNAFTRAYYTLSAVWMGFFVYLFFASFIEGVLVGVSQSFVTVGPVLFYIALLLGAYSMLHARKIVVTEVPISLPNLPPSWKGRKAVWISDLHLGQLHGRSFAEKIVARVSALAHDIVFVGGDLFDGTGAPDLPDLANPFKKLSAPLGVYFITGNHEEFGNRERFLSAVASAGMRALVDEMVEIEGLQLIGVDYKNASLAARFKDTIAKLAIDREKVSILLKHEPKDVDIAQEAGISLQISGHTHKAQLWPLGYIAQLIYRNFSYGLKRFKDMAIYVSSGTGTWGPPMRVGTDSEIVLFTFD